MDDVFFDVNKDVYNNRLLDEDEIEVLRTIKGLKPTTIALRVEDGDSSVECTIGMSPSHLGDANEELPNVVEEVIKYI